MVDNQKNRECTINQLSTCLGLVGVKLSNEELDLIFQRVAKGAQAANYLEIINELRGQMPSHREGAVVALFRDIDVKNRNAIEVNELVRWFKGERHPDIVEKHASAQAIKNDFVDKLDLFGRLGVADGDAGL